MNDNSSRGPSLKEQADLRAINLIVDKVVSVLEASKCTQIDVMVILKVVWEAYTALEKGPPLPQAIEMRFRVLREGREIQSLLGKYDRCLDQTRAMRRSTNTWTTLQEIGDRKRDDGTTQREGKGHFPQHVSPRQTSTPSPTTLTITFDQRSRGREVFFPAPNREGTFSSSHASDQLRPGVSVFRVLLDASGKAGIIEFVADHDVLAKAFGSPESYLNPVCTWQRTRNNNSTTFAVVAPGNIEKHGNVWKVTKPISIKFE